MSSFKGCYFFYKIIIKTRLIGLIHARKRFFTFQKKMSVLFIYFAIIAAATAATTDEQCRTYAGGNVYPDERKHGVEHAIHWSKAQSNFFFIFLNIFSSIADRYFI